MVTKQSGAKRAASMVPFFHGICWTWCCVVVGISAREELLGYNNGNAANWCWINPDKWHWGFFFAGKALEWASTIFIMIVYMVVCIQSNKQETLEPLIVWPTQRGKRDEERRLMLVPIVFIILRLPGNIRTVYYLVTSCTLPYLWVAILHAIGDSLQGFANFLLFAVFNPRIKVIYRKWIFGAKEGEAESFEHGSVRRLVVNGHNNT